MSWKFSSKYTGKYLSGKRPLIQNCTLYILLQPVQQYFSLSRQLVWLVGFSLDIFFLFIMAISLIGGIFFQTYFYFHLEADRKKNGRCHIVGLLFIPISGLFFFTCNLQICYQKISRKIAQIFLSIHQFL
jgi:hypothetical protein